MPNRIANLHIGTPFSGDNAPAVRYYLEDHLGNCSFTLESNGSLFSREDFAARAQAAKKAFEKETSFGSFAKKRNRSGGKERDAESPPRREEIKLYYYGARPVAAGAAWTCRFMSFDPLAGKYPFYRPYQYAGNKPVIGVDLDGLENGNENSTQKEPELSKMVENDGKISGDVLTTPGPPMESHKINNEVGYSYSINSPVLAQELKEKLRQTDEGYHRQVLDNFFIKNKNLRMPDPKPETGLPKNWIRENYGEYVVEENYSIDGDNNYIIWFKSLPQSECYTCGFNLEYIHHPNVFWDYNQSPQKNIDLWGDSLFWEEAKNNVLGPKLKDVVWVPGEAKVNNVDKKDDIASDFNSRPTFNWQEINTTILLYSESERNEIINLINTRKANNLVLIGFGTERSNLLGEYNVVKFYNFNNFPITTYSYPLLNKESVERFSKVFDRKN